jgi:hypothetical protein
MKNKYITLPQVLLIGCLPLSALNANVLADTKCLSAQINFTGSTWYAAGDITITNNCSTSLALAYQNISFTAQDSMGNPVSLGVLNNWWINNAAYTLSFSSGINNSQTGFFATTTPGTSAVINAGQTLTFTGGVSLNNSTFNNSLAVSSISFNGTDKTPSPGPGPGIAPDSIGFHLLLGVSNYSAPQDSLDLTGDKYTDLIMSNFIAGVLYGHLLQTYTPNIQFNKDYLYGSILGQLLQENIATEQYVNTSELIDSNPDQAAVMGMGQGGPYQINNYAVDMVYGSYAPQGYSLINYVTLQKNIGFSLANAATQFSQNTPASFNNKYYGPVLTAYFHFNDYVAMQEIGRIGGYAPSWEPYYDNTLLNFESLPDNFLDIILNVAYNQGYYGPLMTSYSKLGAAANQATVNQVDAYSSVWGVNDTYKQYPYQVRYYLDQLYNNPVPSLSDANVTVIPDNHLGFNITVLQTVFSNVFQTLAYVNTNNQYVPISDVQANTAFTNALTTLAISNTATLYISDAGQRGQIFRLLETAIKNLESSLGTNFSATTLNQL